MWRVRWGRPERPGWAGLGDQYQVWMCIDPHTRCLVPTSQGGGSQSRGVCGLQPLGGKRQSAGFGLGKEQEGPVFRGDWSELGIRRGPQHPSVHQGCSLGNHEARQSGWLGFWWSAIITGRISCLSVGLNRDANRACLGCVYLIQPSIYPPRYLLCSALKWRLLSVRERDDRSWGESALKHTASQHTSKPQDAFFQRTKSEIETCTLMWLQSALKQWTATDQKVRTITESIF